MTEIGNDRQFRNMRVTEAKIGKPLFAEELRLKREQELVEQQPINGDKEPGQEFPERPPAEMVPVTADPVVEEALDEIDLMDEGPEPYDDGSIDAEGPGQ